jgi:hypothetical protein
MEIPDFIYSEMTILSFCIDTLDACKLVCYGRYPLVIAVLECD